MRCELYFAKIIIQVLPYVFQPMPFFFFYFISDNNSNVDAI